MVLPDVFEFRASLGTEAAIAQRARDLSTFTREHFASLGFKCATPANPLLSGALTAFEFPPVDPIPFRERLWNEHRIECPVTVDDSGRRSLRAPLPPVEQRPRPARRHREFRGSVRAGRL